MFLNWQAGLKQNQRTAEAHANAKDGGARFWSVSVTDPNIHRCMASQPPRRAKQPRRLMFMASPFFGACLCSNESDLTRFDRRGDQLPDCIENFSKAVVIFFFDRIDPKRNVRVFHQGSSCLHEGPDNINASLNSST